MKIKLLKIVRKRYTITKYTRLDNPNFFLYGHSVPVWLITDDKNHYRQRICDSFEETHEKLLQMIRKDYYGDMNRKNREISEKVWYKY